MPSTTRGFVYPTGSDDVDVPADMQALAEAIDAYFDNPASFGSTVSAVASVLVSGSGNQRFDLRDTSAGTDLKRSRLRNGGGKTYLEQVNDAYTTVRQGLVVDHATGVVDFPNGATQLAVGSFSAYRNTGVSLISGSYMPVVFDTEDWDVSGWYDTTTGRFTPQRAGFYHFAACVFMAVAGTSDAELALYLYKNGATARKLDAKVWRPFQTPTVAGSAMLNMDGSTDYVDVRVLNGDSVNRITGAGPAYVYFQGMYGGRA